jgi:hypothetical protein
MSNKPVKPGIPMGNTGMGVDAGQPTADEIVKAAAANMPSADELAEAAARRQAHQSDTRTTDERLDHRIATLDEARGGGRGQTWNNDEWDEAAAATDPEKRARIREIFRDSVLPNLPQRAGMHRCWVSTTHNNDTPQKRLRLGYWFYTIDAARQEGWHADEYAVNDAQSPYKGFIMWREMIAMEIPYEDYVMIQREVGHDMPMDQARSIYESIDAAGEQIRSMGGRTTMSPGMETLKQYTRPPRQFE